MTDRATARHRAPRRASTPLSTLSTGITLAMGDRIEALGRGGAVIAVSSGLVASMALPASALTGQTLDDGAATASTPLTGPVSPDVAELDATDQRAAPSPTSLPVDGGSPSALTPEPAAAPASPGEAAAGQAAAGAALAAWAAVTAAPAAKPAAPAATPGRVTTAAPAITATTAAPTAATASTAAPTAKTARVTPAAKTARAATAAPAMGSAVIALASRYVGVPYRYGGSSPSGFDCSGYVQYVYSHLGFKLPRTADQQLHAVRRISRSQARPGDLVFFVYGGYSSHVAIYAGDGMMYDAPHRGARVNKRKIYSASVVFGRVVN